MEPRLKRLSELFCAQ